tara:strand:- start:182 stop:772 length:591 start_codon:yes stop_codon:yes gene_type:complete
LATKHREVYFIQDRLPLRWCFSERQESAEDIDNILNLQRDLITLIEGYADESEIDKGLAMLLSQQIDTTVNEYLESHQVELKIIAPRSDTLIESEVTLSSTGMGFFSQHAVSDGEMIEIEIFLAAIETSVRVVGSVLDSRASSDAENPGYWLRARFVMGQEHATKAITAHISERQRLALEKRVIGANKLSGGVNEA